MTIHQLRLLMESHALTVPELQRPPKPTGEYLYPRQGPLAPDQLRDLYQRQGLQQKQIADIVGCTPGVVHGALTEAGIPLRPRRAAGELERSISRAWLQAEYVDKGRRVTAIARELHTDATSITKLLDKWNIPRSPAGRVPPPRVFPNPFTGLTVPLSPAMQRISTRRNSLQALRRALLVARHPSLRAAALALGIPRTSLTGHLRMLEDAAGFALFDHRQRPVEETERGRLLVDEARQLLALLDQETGP